MTDNDRNAAPERGVGAYVRPLINSNSRVMVAEERSTCWVLSNGRIATKSTEGSSWLWTSPPTADETASNNNHEVSMFSTWEPDLPFYSFGTWGYHTLAHDSAIMDGFSPTPPGVEFCGVYDVVFVAALRYDAIQQQARIFLRRQPNCEPDPGILTISQVSGQFTIGVGGRIGGEENDDLETATSDVIFGGCLELPSARGSDLDAFFGPGYNFFGYDSDSEATSSYTSMASNASLIVTMKNDNKGRMYRVDRPKAFKLTESEEGIVADESARYESQERETEIARRVCKCPHFSFLCHELGLPCSASALITAFVMKLKHPPYIFAKPGDLWLDIKLSTPNRTYVLARRKPWSAEDEESVYHVCNMAEQEL